MISRTGQPFLRGKLPMLAGMALTFAAVATLASAVGAWAVQANAYGRLAALALLLAGGVLKIAYDLAMLRAFHRVEPRH
ncbi:hypothetical protein [Cupriavidus oxalaticus]|uniref:Uncharacterized protein n=1 Tax=Cupriavidus oxalaticus TaxID=96344 RepID=A0A4P7LHW6_9BURK|nr:hypothetical protein E0W60_29480 [Cupriavidus oxalaticus]